MARRSKGVSVRRVTSIDDRNRSQFLSLQKTGDDFQGFALFTPDPEVEDNPGYFEYFDHWDTKASSYVPCADEKCLFCKAGDRPSTRAKTLWLVDDEVKIFTINWSMINEFADMYSEDETVLGTKFRIKRLDDRGKYRITPKADALKKKQLTTLLDGDELPDLEDIVTSQLRRALEDLDVASVMEEDDEDEDEDEEPEEKPKSRRGRPKKEEPVPDDAETPEDIEDEEVTITKISKRPKQITVEYDDEQLVMAMGDVEEDVSEFVKGQVVIISASYDEDDDPEWTLMEIKDSGDKDEDEDEDEESELPDKISKKEFEVVNVNTEDETLDVKSDDYEFVLYFLDEGDAAEVDFDEYEEGDTIVISAVKDKDGDMVATAVPTKPKAKGRSRGRAKAGSKK